VGAILVELITLRPLFPGTSEIDQVYKICSIVGSPLKDLGESLQAPDLFKEQMSRATGPQIVAGGPWKNGMKLSGEMGFKFPVMQPVPLQSIMPTVPDDALRMIAAMLCYDPECRPTAMEGLQNEWFNDLWNTPLGRVAFTPTDSGQLLQILGDGNADGAELNNERDPIILDDPKPVQQTIHSRQASTPSSFELPYDENASNEEIGRGFYNGVRTESPLPTLPYAAPNKAIGISSNKGRSMSPGKGRSMSPNKGRSSSPDKSNAVNTYESFSNPYKALPNIGGNISEPIKIPFATPQKISNSYSQYQGQPLDSHQQTLQQLHELQHQPYQPKHQTISDSSKSAAFTNPFQKRNMVLSNVEPAPQSYPVNQTYPMKPLDAIELPPALNSPTKKKDFYVNNHIQSPKKKPHFFGFLRNAGSGFKRNPLAIEGISLFLLMIVLGQGMKSTAIGGVGSMDKLLLSNTHLNLGYSLEPSNISVPGGKLKNKNTQQSSSASGSSLLNSKSNLARSRNALPAVENRVFLPASGSTTKRKNK
jgi:hypothetical protein